VNFADFLRETTNIIRSKQENGQLILFYFDNAKIHLSKVVMEVLKELKVVALSGPSYTPELNWAEFVIRMVKMKMRKRLDKLK